MKTFGRKKFGKVSIITRGVRREAAATEEGASQRKGGRELPSREATAASRASPSHPGGTWGLRPDPWGQQAARMRSWNLSWCSGRKRRLPRWALGALGKSWTQRMPLHAVVWPWGNPFLMVLPLLGFPDPHPLGQGCTHHHPVLPLHLAPGRASQLGR